MLAFVIVIASFVRGEWKAMHEFNIKINEMVIETLNVIFFLEVPIIWNMEFKMINAQFYVNT